jgi:hypothetical protein
MRRILQKSRLEVRMKWGSGSTDGNWRVRQPNPAHEGYFTEVVATNDWVEIHTKQAPYHPSKWERSRSGCLKR